MSDNLVMGYQVRPQTNTRCDKCHKMIGKDTPNKIGYEIREGIGTGLFCSGFCVRAARQEMLDAHDQEINDIIDFETE